MGLRSLLGCSGRECAGRAFSRVRITHHHWHAPPERSVVRTGGHGTKAPLRRKRGSRMQNRNNYVAPVTLLVGTRKGLFVARSDTAGMGWDVEGPHIAGYEVQAAFLDPRNPKWGYAAADHPVWGKHIYRTTDGGCNWEPLPEVPRHGKDDDDPHSLRMIWSLAPGADSEPDTLYAGIEPPGLFVSRDRGESWQP